jgi:hypothetical protein
MNTNSDLRYWYKNANRWYFGNKLPKDIPVRFGVLPKGVLGSTEMNKKGRSCQAVSVWIAKDIRSRRAIVILTLLHEMVHVENPTWNHGTPFQRRMLRLANDGAMNGLW